MGRDGLTSRRCTQRIKREGSIESKERKNKDRQVQLADVVDVQHKGKCPPACWFSVGIREFTLPDSSSFCSERYVKQTFQVELQR